MSKPAPRITDRNASERSWLEQIPTGDAEAALKFCRALVGQIGGVTEEKLFLNPDPNSAPQGESDPEISVVIPIYN